MASTDRGSVRLGHGHLDATGDREVVYCHACAHEWYRDDHGLTCPECHGDIIEIVSPENDPREFEDHRTSASTSPEVPNRYDGDSDPDEADIEEHIRGQHGFIHSRSTRQGQGRNHHNPAVDPVLNRFIDMLNDLGASNAHEQAQSPGQRSPGGQNESPPLQRGQQTTWGQPHIHRTTFRGGPFGGGTASFTIFSGPVRTQGGAGSGQNQPDPFQQIFSNVINDMGPPGGNDQEGPGPGHPQAFVRSLQDIMGLLHPANAMSGDAVYSQEALDRIISNLMEANPQSNAAPPATDEGLKNLKRKTVDAEMLAKEAKTECSICIDELEVGDTAMFLPCGHWFHENCCTLWLKEHNTCPICRTPIEQRNDAASNGGDGGPSPTMPMPHSGMPGGYSGSFHQTPGDSSETGSQTQNRWFNPGNFGARRVSVFSSNPSDSNINSSRSFRNGLRPTQSARPPSQRHSRLNEALRSVSSMQERQREREREQGQSSGVSYDTSRLQRRSSLSPTSPRVNASEEAASRIRQRSPSQSSRHWAASDRESSRRQSGGGPLSWLRDRLTGNGSNNNGGSSREGKPS